MLSIPKPLVDDLAFGAAVSAEAGWTPGLIPQPLINRYAADNAEGVAELLLQAAQAGIDPKPAEVLAASKWRFGRRPVALLPIAERVMYRAVTQHIRDDLPPYERGGERHSEFIKGPLSDAAKSWVVVTDLANFYSSIPTAALADELTVRSGRWQPVDWLRRFWGSISPYATGIPQVVEPSDWIAEAYADELHRRLLRRGLSVWRYADDFRFATASQSAALAALEAFDEEVRALGLFVNERKTYTQSRDDYESWRIRNIARVPDIIAAVREELKEFDWYSMEPVDAETAEVLQEAAARMLLLWREERGGEDHPSNTATDIEISDLVGRAFQVMSAIEDPTGINYCSEVLAGEPQLTPIVCRYLLQLPKAHRSAVLAEIRQMIVNVPLTKWQRLWVLELIASDVIVPTYESDLIGWVKANLTDTAEYLRAQATWTLGRNWALGRDEWQDAALSMTRLGGPIAAAALQMASGVNEKEKQRLLQSDKLDRGVYEWVQAKGLIPDPF